MSKRIHSILLLTALLVGQQAWAQRPVYRRAPTEEKHSRVGFSMRTLFGVDMELKNLGTVAFPTPLYPDAFGDVEGQGKELLFFNDGYIVYHPDANETTDFQFAWANATKYGNPSTFDEDAISADSFALSRYRTNSTGASAMAENTSKYGWEVSYEYQWGKSTDRVRYGFLAALGFQNLDFRYSGTVDAMRDRQVVLISVANGFLSGEVSFEAEDPGNDEDLGTVVYIGVPSEEGGGAAAIFDPENIDLNQGIVSEGTIQEVAVAFDYDGVMTTLRLGPTVDVKVLADLHLQLSAGIIGTYLNSRLGISQRFDISLTLPVTESTKIAPDEYFEDRNDFLVGFYAEGMLRYQLTPRVGLFGSMTYLKLPELDDPVIGTVSYDLSLTSPVMASAGMVLTF